VQENFPLHHISNASAESGASLRTLSDRESAGPTLRLIYPYDIGVFLYSRQGGGVPIVSNLQAYLDLYARGGATLSTPIIF